MCAGPRVRSTRVKQVSPAGQCTWGTFTHMAQDLDPAELLECAADERLLSGDAALPAAVGRPLPIPVSRRRGRIVGVGATLTGATLISGIILFAVGAVEGLLDGSVLALAVMALGIVLIATHWGWVHVAEFTGNTIEAREARAVQARNRDWLQAIEPYTRYEVSTQVADDGSICIVRTRYQPVRTGERGFTFVAEAEHQELHGEEEPAAEVTERAELLRREAARDTERERERFQAAADAYETALLERGEESARLAARRAASQALSERINENLRDPPLLE